MGKGGFGKLHKKTLRASSLPPAVSLTTVQSSDGVCPSETRPHRLISSGINIFLELGEPSKSSNVVDHRMLNPSS
eukprot:1916388-Amphidinium_carterae.1